MKTISKKPELLRVEIAKLVERFAEDKFQPVAFVPGEAFGAPGYARFSFALGIEDLVDGVSRLAKLVA